MANGTRTHLTQYLTGGYALLIAYASLYPLAGWRDSGGDPLEFIAAPWPRYTTAFDIAANLLAYLPLGIFCTAALRHRAGRAAAVAAALALGAGLSFALEWTQNFLPSRIPSNLDLVCNAGGALLGALIGAHWGMGGLDDGRLAAWRRERVARARGADVGLLLVAAWLMTQLSPETLLFGSGNLRQMLDLPPVQPFAAERFVSLESTVAAAGLLSAALIATLLLRQGARRLTCALAAGALLVKAAAHALLFGPGAALAWITPGNSLGFGVGLGLWWLATFLGHAAQRALAALALLFATVMVNVAPDNPYLHNTLQVWNPGQFLNFNGLTRLVASLWPFLALPWLMTYRPDRHETDYRS